MTCPAPIEIRNPGMTSFANRSRSRTVIPKIARDRRGSAGKAAGSPARRSRRWRRPRRAVVGQPQDGDQPRDEEHRHDHEDDPVGAGAARREADGARDPRRHDAAEDGRPDVGDLLDRELHREQLVAVLGLGVLGQVGRDDDLERLVADRPQRGREDDHRQRLAREQRDRARRARRRCRPGTPSAAPPVGRRRGRERHQRRGRGADRRDQADRLRLEAERREIEVEVDPPQADRRPGDEARDEDQPRVAVVLPVCPEQEGSEAAAGAHASSRTSRRSSR